MSASAENPALKLNKNLRQLKVADAAFKCCFCGRHEINDIEWGVMYQLDKVTLHYFCMLFSSALDQIGQDHEGILGFLCKDILKEVKRGKRLKCKWCRKEGATVGCSIKTCKASFHYTCGYENKCLSQFLGNFQSFCKSHRPLQSIPENTDNKCPICISEVENALDAVWPPCCGKSVFHRGCIMHAAKDAGYFFKCPLCNDRELFIEAMKENGVYVPEQDAEWELVPGAFQELVEHYSKCDIKPCRCPNGIEFDSGTDKDKPKEWRIIRCSGCGSSATHVKCSNLTVYTWKCELCSTVLSRNQNGNSHSSTERLNLEDSSSSSASESNSGSDDDSSEQSDEEDSLKELCPIKEVVDSSSEYETEVAGVSSEEEDEAEAVVEQRDANKYYSDERGAEKGGKPCVDDVRIRRRRGTLTEQLQSPDSAASSLNPTVMMHSNSCISIAELRPQTQTIVSLNSLKQFFQTPRVPSNTSNGKVKPETSNVSNIPRKLTFERKLEQLRQWSVQEHEDTAIIPNSSLSKTAAADINLNTIVREKAIVSLELEKKVLEGVSTSRQVDVMRLPRIPKKLSIPTHTEAAVTSPPRNPEPDSSRNKHRSKKLHQSNLDSWRLSRNSKQAADQRETFTTEPPDAANVRASTSTAFNCDKLRISSRSCASILVPGSPPNRTDLQRRLMILAQPRSEVPEHSSSLQSQRRVPRVTPIRLLSEEDVSIPGPEVLYDEVIQSYGIAKSSGLPNNSNENPQPRSPDDDDDDCVIIPKKRESKDIEILTIDSDDDIEVVFEEKPKNEVPKSSAFVSMLERSQQQDIKVEKEKYKMRSHVVDISDDIDDDIFISSVFLADTSLKPLDSRYNSSTGRGTEYTPHDYWWNSNNVYFDSNDYDINTANYDSGARRTPNWSVRPKLRPGSTSNVKFEFRNTAGLALSPESSRASSSSSSLVHIDQQNSSEDRAEEPLKRPRLS